jgi:5'-nucleotidase
MAFFAKFKAGYERVRAIHPGIAFPQSVPGIFENLDPMPLAVDAVNRLRENDALDVWILSAPSVRNPHCYAKKRI